MRRLWALLAVIGTLLPATARAGESKLFVSRAVEADLPAPGGVGVTRARLVEVDAASLPGADGVSPLPPPATPSS